MGNTRSANYKLSLVEGKQQVITFTAKDHIVSADKNLSLALEMSWYDVKWIVLFLDLMKQIIWTLRMISCVGKLWFNYQELDVGGNNFPSWVRPW